MWIQHVFAFLFLAGVPLADRLGQTALLLVVPLYLVAFLVGDALLGHGVQEQATTRSGWVRLLPVLYIPFQLAVILWGLCVAAAGAADARILGLALATGAAGGIFGVLAAHEMIHSPRRAERVLGTVMLAGVACLHFRLAHLPVHHRLAATLADPSTARRGEGLYSFILRSVAGQWRAAWRLDRHRPLVARRTLHAVTASLAITVGLAVLGAGALLFFAVQSLVAIVILEAFNYVAHYGLIRNTLPTGEREPLGPRHSWNTAHRFNNWALFNGGYHSDHHVAPARPFHCVRALPATPQLPAGYAGTMLLALVPPLWRGVMHPRLPVATKAAFSP
jgi:alkane 1-monooxygenase